MITTQSKKYCIFCGIKIHRQSKQCYGCFNKLIRTGEKRPSHSILMKKMASTGRLPAMGPKSSEQKILQSEIAKKWIKEHGHPRGFLGKKQSDLQKKTTQELGIRIWKDPNSIQNGIAYRQMLSDKAKEQHKNGFLNHSYSRGKMGHYDINGKDIYFRSLWEANYALYLDFLIKQREIKEWSFEQDTFWFEKIRRGVRSYKPDFKVIKNDGGMEYHEVKGWMDKKSATKLKRMAIYHKDIKIIVIDESSYKDIKKKLGKALNFYE